MTQFTHNGNKILADDKTDIFYTFNLTHLRHLALYSATAVLVQARCKNMLHKFDKEKICALTCKTQRQLMFSP